MRTTVIIATVSFDGRGSTLMYTKELTKQLARLTNCPSPAVQKQAAAVLKTLLDETDALACAAKKGRTRKTSRGSKSKGRAGVVEVRDWILATFPELQDDDVVIQTTSVGGQDIHLSPRAADLFPFGIEVKNVQTLNVWKALTQAGINARKKRHVRPLLFFKRNNTPMHVAMDAETFQVYADLLRHLDIRAYEVFRGRYMDE